MTRGFDLQTRLADRDARGLRRDLSPLETVSERSRIADDFDGQNPTFDEQLVFASNNYLGLADDERVRRAGLRAAEAIGTGAGASRLVTGDTPVHRALERDLAATKRTERALVFSSGYAANVGTITALAPDVVFSDAFNHASIIDGCRLSDAEVVVYDHCDAMSLAEAMAERADGQEESWLVVTDSVFSMDGDVAPLAALCDTAERYGAWMMVDEAHATGVFETGGGIVQREELSDRIHVQLGTLSKALAAQGGYVAGHEALIEYLLNAARSFVFSTGLAPPAAGAAREALSIARDGTRREQLWNNVERLRAGLESLGFDVLGETHILPVLIGDRADAMELASQLRKLGIIAPAIRPPTVPDGTSRIRIAPMATHTTRDIEHCIEAFETAERAHSIV